MNHRVSQVTLDMLFLEDKSSEELKSNHIVAQAMQDKKMTEDSDYQDLKKVFLSLLSENQNTDREIDCLNQLYQKCLGDEQVQSTGKMMERILEKCNN